MYQWCIVWLLSILMILRNGIVKDFELLWYINNINHNQILINNLIKYISINTFIYTIICFNICNLFNHPDGAEGPQCCHIWRCERTYGTSACRWSCLSHHHHPAPPFQYSHNWYVFLFVVRLGCSIVGDVIFCHWWYVLVIIQKSMKPILIIPPPTGSGVHVLGLCVWSR